MKKHTKNSFLVVLCGAMLLLSVTGCKKSSDPAPSEISVDNGDDLSKASMFPAVSCGVRLKKAAERVVSLSPAATEIVCELGFKEKLVGISDYCDFPEDLSADKVGSTENPDIDAILKLKPDVVFTLSALSERETYTLNQADIAVLTAEPPKDMEGYSVLYCEIAAAFYGREKADGEEETEKAARIGEDARLVVEKAAKDVRLESFVYVTGKLTVAGGDTFEGAVLGLSGENMCKEKGYVSADMIENAPKYIIADGSLSENDLTADDVLSGYIYGGAEVRFVNASAFERPSARTSGIFKEITASSNEQAE